MALGVGGFIGTGICFSERTGAEPKLMIRSLSRWLSVVVFLLVAGCGDPVARNTDRLMSELYRQGAFSGAVAIIKDGRIVYSRGFGNADETHAFTPDTPADGASLAKPVTAASILVLASEGKLSLDEPARSYVPEFPFPEVTVRHLLGHSAGLPDYDFFEDLIAGGAPTDNASLIAAMSARGVDPAFPAGARFAYCNVCYDTLALIVENVSGKSYADFISERFFGPAGVTSSFIRPAKFADWSGSRTRGFRIRKSGASLNDAVDNEGFHGGANIYFSANDLARWISLWAEGRTIPDAVRAAAVEPVLIGDAVSGVTLGSWFCSQSRTQCYYTGSHQGFFGFGYWDAQRKLAVAFVSNNTLATPLQPGLPRALVDAASGAAAQRFAYDESREDSQANAGAIAGGWFAEGVGDFTVLLDGGEPFLRIGDGLLYRLYPVGFDGLYAPGLDTYLFADAAGETLLWSSVFVEAQARKR